VSPAFIRHSTYIFVVATLFMFTTIRNWSCNRKFLNHQQFFFYHWSFQSKPLIAKLTIAQQSFSAYLLNSERCYCSPGLGLLAAHVAVPAHGPGEDRGHQRHALPHVITISLILAPVSKSFSYHKMWVLNYSTTNVALLCRISPHTFGPHWSPPSEIALIWTTVT
jgi:hypothetical protein